MGTLDVESSYRTPGPPIAAPGSTEIPGEIEASTSIEKRSIRFLLGMGVYNVGLNLLWISFSSILLPVMVENATTAATKGLWVGVISLVSILAGILVNIVAGVVSDHATSKWGRRTPAIVTGTLFAAAVLLAMAFLPQSLPFVFVGFFFLQIAGNVSSGAYQPLLADIIPIDQRGTASGLQSMFTILGAALGFVSITALVSAGQIGLALAVIAVVFVATTIFNSAVIRNDDLPRDDVEPLGLRQTLGEMFRVQTRVPGFFWFVSANYLMYMGVASFASFGIYYFQTVLELPDPVTAMGVAGLVGIVFNVVAAIIAGILSDRIGRTRMIIAAGVCSGVFSLFFPFLSSFGIFILISAFYGAANGVIYSVNQALASTLVPAAESGKFMAYNNLSVGVANAIAPMLFGAILNMRGAPTQGSFVVFFLTASAFYLASSLVFTLRVPRR
jgi:MFS family permease